MDSEFWHARWENKHIGFHRSEVHPQLRKHLQALQLDAGARVFVPLCGKTRDIGWLREQGYHVLGVELSPIAVDALFAELELEPTRKTQGALTHLSAEKIDIWVGDIFQLEAQELGHVDAVYDRAALVALPEPLRTRYTQHLSAITGQAPQLLVCFVYDQRQMSGPPFSIGPQQLREYYAHLYQLQQLENQELPGGLLDAQPASEVVWLLDPLNAS